MVTNAAGLDGDGLGEGVVADSEEAVVDGEGVGLLIVGAPSGEFVLLYRPADVDGGSVILR